MNTKVKRENYVKCPAQASLASAEQGGPQVQAVSYLTATPGSFCLKLMATALNVTVFILASHQLQAAKAEAIYPPFKSPQMLTYFNVIGAHAGGSRNA